jgi:hypothetical protein
MVWLRVIWTEGEHTFPLGLMVHLRTLGLMYGRVCYEVAEFGLRGQENRR